MRDAHGTTQATQKRGLGDVSAEFAGLIATAVWLRKLSEEAACDVLRFYAMACQSGTGRSAAAVLDALMAEYRLRRAQQDICW